MNPTMKIGFAMCAAGALLLMGCGSQHRLHIEESALGTDGPITRQFHSVLYYPFEIMPRFDGYLVGIEKVPGQSVQMHVFNRSEYGLDDADLQKKFSDRKTMVVTHVVKHSADPLKDPNCTIFNAYVQSEASAAHQLIGPCSPPAAVRDAGSAFKNSWDALDELKQDISQRHLSGATRYTHLLVIVMGWNTIQEEAVRNVNSLVWNMKRASSEGSSAETFNPLVVTVTWPSQWSSDWIDPAVKLISFPTKAGDADEVGMSWLGVLLHETLPTEMPVMVIGHSFGAKATSVASCAGPAIRRNGAEDETKLRKIDALVNLQPAYLSERIFGRGELLKNVVYPQGCPNINQFIATSSRSDEAVPLPFWGTYLGEGKSYERFCGTPTRPPSQQLVGCSVANSDGSTKLLHAGTSRITYVDASALISEQAFGTGGGSHSDIYRREHGRFLYSLAASLKRPDPHTSGPKP